MTHRYKIVHDDDPDWSYLEQTNDDGSPMFPGEMDKVLSGTVWAVGIVREIQCEHCDCWAVEDSLWGVDQGWDFDGPTLFGDQIVTSNDAPEWAFCEMML